MKNILQSFSKTENRILLVLWISILITYPLAILSQYNLFLSDYFGLVALIIVTIIAMTRQIDLFPFVLILLLLGVFNVFSFVYFINIVFRFGISSFISPGIQLYSLILLIILIRKRSTILHVFWIRFFGKSDQEKQQNKEKIRENFKIKFRNLSDEEINRRLKNDLVPEAKQALLEILEERQNETKNEK